MGLPLLEKVYQQYKANDKLAFLAVSVDQADLKDEKLRDAFKELGVTVPIARDPEQHAAKVFETMSIPTTFLLGSSGAVQDYQMGVKPDYDAELTAKLDQLLAGKDIYSETLKRLAQERAQYQEWLEKWVKKGL